ncbi:glycoside hydrolase family 28 protein [Salegentibacter sp. F188]|uniref:Glycoside hydrolase family 28 protein n=1 Tax=Autumnicola patrickiae TaxID=3075591 RepID=A0ABU3DYU2_9FLAO|nr:glycoside hydrolase family 28 protein [Salegentibacter sp. F188]MDT0688898.1 glycoside hydrolase family 28 protein [Salegentibacter sp. F188]
MKRYIIVLVIFMITNIMSAQLDETAREKVMGEIINRIELPAIPDYTISIMQFNAKGDSLTDNKQAFDKAMQAIKENGGGTIVVPKGIYNINGPIHFVDNVNLKLEEGARLKFGSNPKDYPLVLTSWEGTMLYNYSPMIYGIDLENIAITGKGTIDGEAKNSWANWRELQEKDQLLSREMNHNNVPVEERIFGEGHYLRPQLIQFVNSRNILIEDVTIEDAPFWCLHLLKCSSATLRGLKYDAHNYNNDGIDLEYTRDILIENVKFDNGDDNLAIKAGRDHEGRSNADQASQNIVMRNCLLKGLHGVVIGSEMSAGVKNIFVDNCKAWGDLKRGIYFKTNPDRGGYMKDIYVSNIELGKVEDLFFITANYHGEGEGFNSKISDIYINNVTSEEATGTAIVIEGYEDSKVENVKLNNIHVKKASNAITIKNTENVVFEQVIIGEEAGVPTTATTEEVSKF